MNTALAIDTSTARHGTPSPRVAPVAKPSRPAYLRPVPAQSGEERASVKLASIGSVANYARGQTVFEEGNPAEYVVKVVSGALRAVRLLPDGRRYITSFLLPGDFFGLSDSEQYSQSLEAVADVTLVRYSRRAFLTLLDNDHAIGRQFFGMVCSELTSAQNRLLLLGRKSAIERVSAFLLAMADSAARHSRTAGNQVDLPMKRADVADYLGLTVETVSRVLTQLRGRKIIDLPTANHVVLLKRGALEDISES